MTPPCMKCGRSEVLTRGKDGHWHMACPVCPCPVPKYRAA